MTLTPRLTSSELISIPTSPLPPPLLQQNDDDDDDDEMVGFGVEEQGSGSPSRTVQGKTASYAKDRQLSDMLEGNLDFDVDIDPDGVIVDYRKKEQEERRRQKVR